MAVNATWEVPPGALTNNVGTTLQIELDAGTPCASQLQRHAQARVPAGVVGTVQVAYKWVMLLLGSVARVDGSPAVGALKPLRGAFDISWINAALVKADSLGAFAIS